MSDTVIRVENLGKKYIIGHQQQERYTSLRDVITNKVKSLGSLINSKGKVENPAFEEFWALKDVSFEIKQGDRVGIIGRNGAGKSTLLKILSRITEPTKGSIKIKGRVASLLEVGTGFHPELTGRENIFLNGAILGMGKEEIKRKFDEIVAFAEVEKFLDTPVKRYSSGMYVRLAFAVAAHLEPEILIVDEVLAVGDAAFQKKCLGKMEDVATHEGRTVLFVSHNISAIISLCNRTLLLNNGTCIGDGKTDKIINQYLSTGKISQSEISDNSKPSINQKLKIRKIRLIDELGETHSEFDLRNQVFVEISWEVIIPGKKYNTGFEIHNVTHGCVFTSSFMDGDPNKFLMKLWDIGYYKFKIKIPTQIMKGGEYWIKVASAIPTVEVLDVMRGEIHFTLIDTNSPIVKSGEGRNGCILPILTWNVSN